jgi:PAS domain-containing protein
MKEKKKDFVENRLYKRLDVNRQSVEIELIIDNFKRLHGLSIVSNISLGGMGLLVKEPLKKGTLIKFHLGKSKTVFDAKVIWVRDSGFESLPYSVGVSIIFPYENESEEQKRELIEFVIKNLKKLAKPQLVDRLMELFIERRRVFDAARNHIKDAEIAINEARKTSEISSTQAHNIVDFNLTPVLYIGMDLEILYSNEAAEKFLGFSLIDMKDLKTSDILNKNTNKNFIKNMGQKVSKIYNGVIILKSGDEKNISWRIVQSSHNKKEISCFMFQEKFE